MPTQNENTIDVDSILNNYVNATSQDINPWISSVTATESPDIPSFFSEESSSTWRLPTEEDYHDGICVLQNEPRYEDSIEAYVVENPGGNVFHITYGLYMWSNLHTAYLQIGSEIDQGVWEYEWVPESTVFPEFYADELDAEFTDWEYGEPFDYAGRMYVVLHEPYWPAGRGRVPNDYYHPNQVFYSEYTDREYRLGVQVRTSMFGSVHSFRCEWCEMEPDGYSEETVDSDVSYTAPVIPAQESRTIPLISFEQEFSGNGDAVARRLYDAGYAYSPHAVGYHQSEGRYEGEGERICYVETDSSCGYELIFSKIDLTDRSQADAVSECQKILKELRDEEQIRLSARCGFHVHLDVSRWGMKEIVSAYHLWNYLEDPIFRMSSAFWATHRDEEVGGGYSSPVPKGYTSRTDIGNIMYERRDALNFSHILRARGNCGCGAARHEDWSNCTCNIGQQTLEFRVFNATINPRKIRAYIAFCAAFVNMAMTHDHSPEFFPEMRWIGTNVKRNLNDGKSWFDGAVERVNYILKEFPLTSSEKSDLLYCLRNCSLEEILEFL